MDVSKLIAELQRDVPTSDVKSRSGGGGTQLSYVDQFYVIEELNRIFGHSWSFEFVHAEWTMPPWKEVCFVDPYDKKKKAWMPESPEWESLPTLVPRRWRAEYTYTGRLIVGDLRKDGTAVGHAIASSRGEAMHNAVGEAETDALKRAARLFGRRLGLALYDKDQRYISEELAPERVQHGGRSGALLTDMTAEFLTKYHTWLKNHDAANHGHIQCVEQALGALVEAESGESEGVVPEVQPERSPSGHAD